MLVAQQQQLHQLLLYLEKVREEGNEGEEGGKEVQLERTRSQQ